MYSLQYSRVQLVSILYLHLLRTGGLQLVSDSTYLYMMTSIPVCRYSTFDILIASVWETLKSTSANILEEFESKKCKPSNNATELFANYY